MGLIMCEKHGTTGIILICPHISSAVSSNTNISLNIINEKFFGEHWLCSDCIEVYKKNTITDEFLEEFISRFKPECWKCFYEWKDSLNINTLETHNLDMD